MYTGPNRKPTRVPGFDYRDAGPYFVTICEYRRQNRFGQVVDGRICLNAQGQMVHDTWRELAGQFPGIALEAFVVMPNHVHGLVTLDIPAAPARHGRRSLTDVVGESAKQKLSLLAEAG